MCKKNAHEDDDATPESTAFAANLASMMAKDEDTATAANQNDNGLHPIAMSALPAQHVQRGGNDVIEMPKTEEQDIYHLFHKQEWFNQATVTTAAVAQHALTENNLWLTNASPDQYHMGVLLHLQSEPALLVTATTGAKMNDNAGHAARLNAGVAVPASVPGARAILGIDTNCSTETRASSGMETSFHSNENAKLQSFPANLKTPPGHVLAGRACSSVFCSSRSDGRRREWHG